MAICGLIRALSFTITEPVALPFDFGANATLMMHAAEGFTTLPCAQVVPEAKAKLPLTEMALRVRGVVPVFSSAIVCAELVEPTFCAAKFSTNGLSDACGSIGVPESGTDCGLPAAESVITSEADCVVVWSCA